MFVSPVASRCRAGLHNGIALSVFDSALLQRFRASSSEWGPNWHVMSCSLGTRVQSPCPPACHSVPSNESQTASESALPQASSTVTDLDCVIIGAGWTGLSVAAALRAYGVERFTMFEAGSDVGSFWAGNYDRIRLHTPWHGLPCDSGYSLYRYPMFKSKREILRYLQDYYRLHRLETYAKFSERVLRITNIDKGRWHVETQVGLEHRVYHCKCVAVCTSKLRVPFVPEVRGSETFSGQILHSRAYHSGKDFEKSDVLVVGSGNSAAEISADLVECGAGSVTMLVHGPRLFVPLPRLGLAWCFAFLRGKLTEEQAFSDFELCYGDESYWAAVQKKDEFMSSMAVDMTPFGIRSPELGFTEANVKYGRIGTFDQGAIAMIKSKRIGVRAARLTGFTESEVQFDVGPPLRPDVVVLATGFQPGLEEIIAEPERFLAPHQEGKGCGTAYATPLTDGRCRSSIDDSLFFVGFDQAVNGGLSMGFWGWSSGFLIAQRLGLQPAGARFSLEMLPERQRDVCRRRNMWQFAAFVVGSCFALATSLEALPGSLS